MVIARRFLSGDYLDLEKPSDQQVFSSDIEFALRQFEGPLIIDEDQTIPEIFAKGIHAVNIEKFLRNRISKNSKL